MISMEKYPKRVSIQNGKGRISSGFLQGPSRVFRVSSGSLQGALQGLFRVSSRCSSRSLQGHYKVLTQSLRISKNFPYFYTLSDLVHVKPETPQASNTDVGAAPRFN